MEKTQVKLIPLQEDDRDQFVRDNQWAFKYGSVEEFGMRNDQFEEEGEIISRRTIEDSIDKGEAYRIICEGEKAGGVVIHIDGTRGELDLLFTLPEAHSKGIGYAAWCEIERLHPEVEVWETLTPYFETRNIHFYVNKCGFHIVEFFNPFHPEPERYSGEDREEGWPEDGGTGGTGLDFRFEKRMK